MTLRSAELKKTWHSNSSPQYAVMADERHLTAVTTSTLYSGGPEFKSRYGKRLLKPTIFVVFLSSSMQMLRQPVTKIRRRQFISTSYPIYYSLVKICSMAILHKRKIKKQTDSRAADISWSTTFLYD